MKIFVFGNENLKEDSLPLKILPKLQEKFADIKFETKDPNEEWEILEELIVLDTIVGIKEVKVFGDLEKFSAAPRVGVHDFDALTNLRYLWKLGKIKKIKIIGLPPKMKESEALQKVSQEIRMFIKNLY
jgi:hypothetical protein